MSVPKIGNKWLWIMLPPLFLCGLFFWTFQHPGVTDCWIRKCPPERNFHVLQMDLPSQLFPERALVNDLHDNDHDNSAIEAGIKTVYWNNGNGLAIYIVERFRTQEEASRRYISDERQFNSKFVNAENFNFMSNVANDAIAVCGVYYPYGSRCAFAAYYEEYYVYFNTYPDDEMKVEEFLRIIEQIDKAIVEKLVIGK